MKRLFLAILFVLLTASGAWGATKYVTSAGSGAADGSSYANSMSLASFKAGSFSAGDTIYFCGAFSIGSTAITVPSSGSAIGGYITIDGNDGTHQATITSSGVTSGCMYVNDKDYVHIKNLYFAGSTSTINGAPVKVYQSSYVKVSNCNISGSFLRGIFFYYSDHCEAYGNYLKNSGSVLDQADGIKVLGSHDCKVYQNELDDWDHTAIELLQPNGATGSTGDVYNIEVYQNNIYLTTRGYGRAIDVSPYVFEAGHLYNIYIWGNTISGMRTQTQLNGAANVFVFGNTFYDTKNCCINAGDTGCTEAGVDTECCSSCQLTYRTGTALKLQDTYAAMSYVWVFNNTIWKASEAGFTIENDSLSMDNIHVLNNIIYDGARLASATGGYTPVGSTNDRYDFDLCVSSTTNLTNSEINNNIIYSTLRHGSNDIAAPALTRVRYTVSGFNSLSLASGNVEGIPSLSAPDSGDFSIGLGPGINNGSIPFTYTKSDSDNVLTISPARAAGCFGTGVAFDDEKRAGTVESYSISDGTVTLTDASSWDSTGGILPFAWGDAAPDAGATQKLDPPGNSDPDTGIITVLEHTSGDAQVADNGFVDCTSDPSDPDTGDALSFEWDMDNDGTTDSTEQNPANLAIGDRSGGEIIPFRFRVTDQLGAYDEEITQIQVTPAGEDPVEGVATFGRNSGNTYDTGGDTFIDGTATTTNYSSSAWLTVHATNPAYALFDWDLSDFDHDASAAEINITKRTAVSSGTLTLTAYVCTDTELNIGEATYAAPCSGGTWDANFGTGTLLGSVVCNKADAVGTKYTIAIGDFTALDAATGSGTYRVILKRTAGTSSSFQWQSNEDTGAEWGPELEITYSTEQEPEAPTITWTCVSPNPGVTIGVGNKIRFKGHSSLPLTITITGAKELALTADSSTFSCPITASDGETINDIYFEYTVQEDDTSANFTLDGTITQSDDKIEYGGLGGTEIAYTCDALATGIVIDTSTPDFALGTFSHIDCTTHELVENATIYTTGDSVCFMVADANEDTLLFNAGPSDNIQLGLYGDRIGLLESSSIGSTGLIFKYIVALGDVVADLQAAGVDEDTGFIHGATAIINSTLEEVSDYALPDTDPEGGVITIIGNGFDFVGNIDLSDVDNGTWTDNVTGDISFGDSWVIENARFTGTITVGAGCVLTRCGQ